MYTYNEIMLILGMHMPVTGVVCSFYAKHPDAMQKNINTAVSYFNRTGYKCIEKT